MKQDLVFNINKLISKVKDLLKENTTYRTRKELSEAYISLALLHDKFNLESISKTSIEYLMNRIVHNICHEGYFGYYMGFYYLPQKVYNKQAEELSNEIYQSNINISCFRCLIHASGMLDMSLDTSANNYFFSRGSKISSAIKNYMAHPFEFDISAMIYLALNYYQTLNEYEQCTDTTYNHYVPKLKNDFEDLFRTMLKKEDFISEIQSNQQLLAFWCSIVPKEMVLKFELYSLPQIINVRYRWIVYSYYFIDADKAEEFLKNTYKKMVSLQYDDVIQIALIIRLLCMSLLYNSNTDISDIDLLQTQTDGSSCVKYSLGYFFKNYDSISQQNCTEQDLQTLMEFDDSALRQKVAACMQNVDKNELERQISKPHGTLEISDLDIKFYENGELKYLCMPFKTGREITKASMDESYMYQLLKPFSHFGAQCLVVLITAKKCSQGLETYIQRMSVKEPSWRIEVIQNMQLCKLLKINSQI